VSYNLPQFLLLGGALMSVPYRAGCFRSAFRSVRFCSG